MLSIAAIAVRAFLLMCAAVVLGLSVSVAKHQVTGSVPSETAFSSFAGGFGILISLVGLASLWIDKIPKIFVMAADGLASIFFLAGGIALTLALKPVSSCTDMSDLGHALKFDNKLLNGGCRKTDTGRACYTGRDNGKDLPGRCQRVQADYVFEYLAFIFGLAAVVLGFLLHRKGGTSSRAYV